MDRQVTSAGLYRPSDEHDACGVGFVANIKGARSHPIVRSALDLLINLEHRGACGSDPDTGDGAGILIQMPDRFFRKARAVRAAAGGLVRRRPGVPAARCRSARRRARRSSSASSAKKARRCSAGAKCRSTSTKIGKTRGLGRAGLRAGVRRRHQRISGSGISGALRAQALRHPQADRARDEGSLHLRPVVEDADLQGHADRVADRGHVPRSVRPERRIRARARAPALLDQHVPVLAAGASVSLRRAQRRDQHAARQHQLDEGARRPAEVERVRRRPAEGAAGDRAGRQRHRDLRQRARVPGDGGPLAAARGADDDSRAVGGQPGDGSGGARVLRIPLVADGAVGRPGVDHLHRRPADRRRARSQRPAPVALLHHHGRPRDHGVGSRRPRHPRRATSSSRIACARARCC